MLLLCLGACNALDGPPPAGVHVYDIEQLQAYVVDCGLVCGKPEGFSTWQDVSGRTVFLSGGRKTLILLTADQESPLVVSVEDMDNNSLRWVDGHGKIWSWPEWAKPLVIDRQSGLFVSYAEEESGASGDGQLPFAVGRMDHPSGWLYNGSCPRNQRSLMVAGLTNHFIFSQIRNFKVQGLSMVSRPHAWLWASDPTNPDRLVQLDELWLISGPMYMDPFQPRYLSGNIVYDYVKHEEVWRVPQGKVAYFLDGDWLGPRLATASERLHQESSPERPALFRSADSD